MKRFYYLSTCDTCKRIMDQLALPDSVELIDIKLHPPGATDIDAMQRLSGSYEALFSKRARLYKERNLKEKDLGEADYKELLTEHYTFLKRPVLIWDDTIVIGNSKASVQAALNTVTRT